MFTMTASSRLGALSPPRPRLTWNYNVRLPSLKSRIRSRVCILRISSTSWPLQITQVVAVVTS